MLAVVRSENGQLAPLLRAAVAATAVINLVIGLAFLFGPELSIPLWPTSIPPLLMRFIGAIVVGNGVGAALVAQAGTWESARALFAVALVYGLVVLIALLYHLLAGTAAPVFWGYVIVDAIFLVPIGAIFWNCEWARRSR